MRTPSLSSPSPQIENRVADLGNTSSVAETSPIAEISTPDSAPKPGIEEPNPNSDPKADIQNPNPDSFSEAAAAENPSAEKESFSLWNAVVKAPMRRLQERLLGSRWASTSEPSRSSIWLLGVCYSLCEDGSSGDATGTEAYADFQTDYSSRIWFTYRKGFEALGPAKMISDVGWGCMLRSGQMLLAQALVCHYLGRHWRRKPSEPNAQEYLKILQCFGDLTSQGCPFSIHNILKVGVSYGLVAGSWLGPYALCRSLEALAHTVRESSENDKLERRLLPMEVYVVSGDADGERGGAPCICMDDIESLCTNTGVSVDGWAPILLLVPLVLGVEKVNSRYLPSLWATFTFPQSLGIMGGKPGASTYLVGVQDDQALYLDPHEVQEAVIVSPDNLEVETSSYHCSAVKKIPLTAIDPSLALGFYCHDRGDFEDLCERASELARESNGAPMFTVVNSSNKGGGQRDDLLSVKTGEFITLDGDHAPSEDDWQIL